MPVTAQYTVTGMTCGHCVQAVTEELSSISGVQKVDVDLSSGEVTVVSDEQLSSETVASAVDEAGYALSP